MIRWPLKLLPLALVALLGTVRLPCSSQGNRMNNHLPPKTYSLQSKPSVQNFAHPK